MVFGFDWASLGLLAIGFPSQKPLLGSVVSSVPISNLSTICSLTLNYEWGWHGLESQCAALKPGLPTSHLYLPSDVCCFWHFIEYGSNGKTHSRSLCRAEKLFHESFKIHGVPTAIIRINCSWKRRELCYRESTSAWDCASPLHALGRGL